MKGGTVPETISDFQIDNTAEAASGSEATISGTLTLSDEAEASSDLLKSEVSKITWNSSDSGVAEVKGCTGQNASDNRSTSLTVTIAAKKAGIAVITGTTSNGKKASCTVTVKGTTVSETPKNPVHHCTKENDGTDTTDWSYVYFGSYPQTEVTGAALTPAITGASYDENKDAWVNGVKYRRISKSDMNYDGYFGDSEYRYFKWERMKWRVLQNNGSTMFVVADKGLDCKDYNDTYEPVTWEDCTLRNWLNNDFYNMAFSDSEQGAVIGQTVSNEDNLEYGTAGGNNTADKVYLLSDRELTDRSYGFCEDYNVWSASRRFNTSDYSCARGASRDCDDEGNQYCWWWLRSPGRSTYEAINVDTDGRIKQDGTEVLISCDVSLAVIPALHIDLSSNLWSLAEADKPNIPNIPDCTHTHTELRNQKNPTCQAAGYSGDKWCKDCQKQIETGKTLAKTAHNLQTTVTKATDSKNGSIQKKCKLCGFVQSNTVINRIQSASVSQTKYTYDGTKKQPTVSVLDSAGKKIDSQYYTVSYQNNASVGTASAVITFKGNYSGTLVKNFDINSQTTRITKVKAKNKGFEAKWKKQASQTTGYQLQYSTSKKFTKKTTKTKTVKKSSKTNLTIGKLKSGKKYYVRIRTYQTVNGTKYYSEWSKSKKITTKRS